MDLKDWLILFSAVLSGAITPIALQLLQRKSKQQDEAETSVDIAEAANKIVTGGAEAVEAMKKVLLIYETRDTQHKQEIQNLQARLTAMQLDEVEKERINRERNNAIAEEIDALKKYIEVLVGTLRENNIDIPPRPEILKDSGTLQKIKAIKK